MSHARDPPDGGGEAALHFWLPCPLHVHRITDVPLAVPAPLASRHRPDWTPVMDPSEFWRHCWFGCPLQFQMMTGVPGVVCWWEAPTHRVPLSVWSCPAEVNSKDWPLWPLQSHRSSAVPGVGSAPVTSRQRPEAAPTRGA